MNFGFAQLPQHMGNWFFKEQLGHLEIAVKEYEERRADYLNYTAQPNQNTRFEDTQQGKLYVWLKAQGRPMTYHDIAAHFGKTSRHVAKVINNLEGKGFFFKKEMKQGKMTVRVI